MLEHFRDENVMDEVPDFPDIGSRVERIAEELGLTLIRSRKELEPFVIKETVFQTVLDALADLRYLPQISEVIVRYIYEEILRASSTENDHQGATVLVIPGYLAPNPHLGRFKEALNGSSRTSDIFRSPSPQRRVMKDATMLADDLMRRNQPRTNLLGHSRGGLVGLVTLKILQERGRDDLVTSATLVATPANGINPPAAAIARSLRIEALLDLCPNSEAVGAWQGLDEKNRKKVIVITSIDGDAFTSPERSFVPGAQMLLTPRSSHQAKALSLTDPAFRAAVALHQHQ